uniref:Uncharacterized protein n=1 Tax=Rhizophora mucronata TaxID=61149 RepID=A0A2P2NM43_RHIMU
MVFRPRPKMDHLLHQTSNNFLSFFLFDIIKMANILFFR